MRRGVWTELAGAGPVKVDAFRRNLQRAYLDTLAERINGRQAASDDARALFERGAVVPRKRPRGRPRKEDVARDAALRVETEARMAAVQAP